jgi:hypothetical protein
MAVTFLMSMFFWYYMIVFCAVYVVSSKTWLLSGLQALTLDWCVFELIQPLGLTIIRVLCQRYKSLM